jgi:hypothetical protein
VLQGKFTPLNGNADPTKYLLKTPMRPKIAIKKNLKTHPLPHPVGLYEHSLSAALRV